MASSDGKIGARQILCLGRPSRMRAERIEGWCPGGLEILHILDRHDEAVFERSHGDGKVDPLLPIR
jgi:hypothetical protein